MAQALCRELRRQDLRDYRSRPRDQPSSLFQRGGCRASTSSRGFQKWLVASLSDPASHSRPLPRGSDSKKPPRYTGRHRNGRPARWLFVSGMGGFFHRNTHPMPLLTARAADSMNGRPLGQRPAGRVLAPALRCQQRRLSPRGGAISSILGAVAGPAVTSSSGHPVDRAAGLRDRACRTLTLLTGSGVGNK